MRRYSRSPADDPNRVLPSKPSVWSTIAHARPLLVGPWKRDDSRDRRIDSPGASVVRSCRSAAHRDGANRSCNRTMLLLHLSFGDRISDRSVHECLCRDLLSRQICLFGASQPKGMAAVTSRIGYGQYDPRPEFMASRAPRVRAVSMPMRRCRFASYRVLNGHSRFSKANNALYFPITPLVAPVQ